MADDLSQLPFGIKLDQFTRNIIRQNLIIAMGVIGLLMISSIFNWAILIHEGSTILGALNSLRRLAFASA